MRKERLRRIFFNYWDNISIAILSLWCLLPIAVVIIFLTMGAHGKFVLVENAVSLGFPFGGYNNTNAIASYYLVISVLSIITIIYATLLLGIKGNALWKRNVIVRKPWFFLLMGVLLWAAVSTAMSDDPLHGFTGGDYFHDGLSSYFFYAALFLCASSLGEEIHRLWILRLFGLMVSFLAILMITQEWTRNPFLDYCFPSFRAVTFNQFNHFGYILSMAALALAGLYLHDRRGDGGFRFVYLAGFGLTVYAILVNDSFGALVTIVAALPVAYVFYVRHGGKWRFGVILPALVMAAVIAAYALGFAPNHQTLANNLSQFGTDISNIATGAEEAASAGTGRLRLWRDTLKRISQRPIFGFGPEGFYGENAIGNNESPHNEYLQIAGYLGIPALLMYLGALLTLARDHWKRIRELSPMVVAVSGASVAYLISACFGNPVFNTAPYFWMFLGMTTADGVNPPLLSIDPDAAAAQLSAKSSGRRVGIIIGIGAALLAGIVGGSLYLNHQTEKTNETADLQCMRGAESVCLLGLKTGNAQIGETYWLDAGSYALIPIREPAPQPYGMGTARQGGALAPFLSEYGSNYSYDEAADYREMVIKINILQAADGEPRIELNWVKP